MDPVPPPPTDVFLVDPVPPQTGVPFAEPPPDATGVPLVEPPPPATGVPFADPETGVPLVEPPPPLLSSPTISAAHSDGRRRRRLSFRDEERASHSASASAALGEKLRVPLPAENVEPGQRGGGGE